MIDQYVGLVYIRGTAGDGIGATLDRILVLAVTVLYMQEGLMYLWRPWSVVLFTDPNGIWYRYGIAYWEYFNLGYFQSHTDTPRLECSLIGSFHRRLNLVHCEHCQTWIEICWSLVWYGLPHHQNINYNTDIYIINTWMKLNLWGVNEN